jgi:lactoylglutathione lyase
VWFDESRVGQPSRFLGTAAEGRGSVGTWIIDVGVVGVPVNDQDGALAFCVGTLGFGVRVDAPMPGGDRWVMVARPSATTAIALIAAHPGHPAGVETGIRFASRDAVVDHDDLAHRGVEVGERLRWPGVPVMFALKDQDGNGLEIIDVPAVG